MNIIDPTILKGIQEAMKTESDGHHFYLMAARSIQDPKGRQVFETLAQEELAHFRFLTTQYKSISTSGQLDKKHVLGPRTKDIESNPIFSDDIRSRIGDAHFEMSALSIGIQLEINSERHYRDLADSTQDLDVKKFYLELSDWESSHYHRLLREQEALKELYWNSGGFAPF